MADNTSENYSAVEMPDDTTIIGYVYSAVSGMEGLSGFVDAGMPESIADAVLRREVPVHGTRIIRNDDGSISVNMKIRTFYGYNIPQLSYDMQSTVKKAVEEETHIRVKAVNISVEGIDRPREQNE